MGVSQPLILLITLVLGAIIILLAVVFLFTASGNIKQAFEEMVNNVIDFIKGLFSFIIPW